ncbi:MAG: sugar phosphate isomerase/epimerase family protein, partial [Terriglobia bacterium]
IVLGVEPHIGSIVPTPAQVLHRLELTPNLTLTLDYGHFTCQGIPDHDVSPLIPHASHFHARAASNGKLQASLSENTIDFARIFHIMRNAGYAGYIVLEYVWTEWMHCNEVDNLTETVLLRDKLRSIAAEAAAG